MKKRVLAVMMCVTLVASVWGCGSTSSDSTTEEVVTSVETEEAAEIEEAAEPEEVYTINFGISIAQGTEREESYELCYAETFEEYVEEASNGAIQVEVFYGNSLGSDADVIAGISAGTIEMMMGEISMSSTYWTDSLIFSIPGAFSSMEESDALYDSEWAQEYYDEMAAETNLKVLTMSNKGFRHFTTVDEELTTVDTINGLNIRVLTNTLYIAMVEELGANPVPLDISELFSALQNGVVDGHENSIANILGDQTYEVEKYIVLDSHTANTSAAYISDSYYESLPEDLQAVIDDGAAAALEAGRIVNYDLIESGIATLEEYGVSIYTPTDEELEEWHATYRDAVMEVAYDEIGEDVVNDFLEAIEIYGQ